MTEVHTTLPLSLHRHVLERVVAFHTVATQACARRASKALWEAVSAASTEDLLRATVLEHRTRDAELVVVAMSRAVGPFPSDGARLAWCGGIALLYDELRFRFINATAFGISAQLVAIRPFPFASGWTVTTACIVTAAASAPLPGAVDSVVLGLQTSGNTSVLVSVVSSNNAPCPILCLEGAMQAQMPEMLHDVPLHTLPSIRSIASFAFLHCASLTSVSLANLPLLESIEDHAFGACVGLSKVDVSRLPSLRRIRPGVFCACKSLQSISLSNLPLLDSIAGGAFDRCVNLSYVDLSGLPSLNHIGPSAFSQCKSLQSISFADLPRLEFIGESAFSQCVNLSSLDLINLPSLQSIGAYAFWRCKSLQSISFANLPLLGTIDENVFAECVRLSKADLSGLRSLCRRRAVL